MTIQNTIKACRQLIKMKQVVVICMLLMVAGKTYSQESVVQSGTFNNHAYKVKGRRYGSPTLLDLFEIYNVKADTVSIMCDKSGGLELTYKDDEGKFKTEKFKGTFAKKGYYEVFLSNEKKEIPPVFPIIFSKYNVNRIRLALTVKGDLIVDNKWIKGGNIFILGAGDKGRRQSFFIRKK
jgi:hypothetical protein